MRQCRRVDGRLGRAGAGMRAGDKRGIAGQAPRGRTRYAAIQDRRSPGRTARRARKSRRSAVPVGAAASRLHPRDHVGADQRRRNAGAMMAAGRIGAEYRRASRRRSAGTRRCYRRGVRPVCRCRGPAPDSRAIARLPAGRRRRARTLRGGCRAVFVARRAPRARRHSRHRPAPTAAEIAPAPSSATRRRRSTDRRVRACRRRKSRSPSRRPARPAEAPCRADSCRPADASRSAR